MRFGPLAVLRHREFATVWGAGAASDIGTWMQVATLGIVAVALTGEAKWVGILTTITYITSGLLYPLRGVAADRYDRRKVILIAVALQAAAALVLWLLFVNGVPSLWWVAVVVAVQGAMSAWVNPARGSLIPDLVPTAEIPAAASLTHVSGNAGRAIGPLLAAAVLTVMSPSAVFALNGLSFTLVGLAVLTVRPRHHAHVEAGNTWQRIKAGTRGLRGSPACRRPTSAAAAEIILAAPFIALIPVMAQLTLGGNAAHTGWLFAAQGIGSACGVLMIVAFIPRLGQERVLRASVMGVGVLGIAYAWSGSIYVACAVILPLSAAHSSVLAGSVALLQRDAPARIRGRVIALYLAITNVGYGLSSSLLATLADLVGLRPVLTAGSFALLVYALLSLSRAQGPERIKAF